jgi:hypothetical protein
MHQQFPIFIGVTFMDAIQKCRDLARIGVRDTSIATSEAAVERILAEQQEVQGPLMESMMEPRLFMHALFFGTKHIRKGRVIRIKQINQRMRNVRVQKIISWTAEAINNSNEFPQLETRVWDEKQGDTGTRRCRNQKQWNDGENKGKYQTQANRRFGIVNGIRMKLMK